jgi:hypothetical protein
MADTAPGQVIRRHCLGCNFFYAVAAQGTMQVGTMLVCARQVLTIVIMARLVSGL